MSYAYKRSTNGQLLQNRLYHVNDPTSSTAFTDDIDDMGTFESDPLLINSDNNYAYDELGQLIKDEQEAISEIRWRNDGKISTIIRNSGSGEEMLQFAYNPNGERISKKVFDDNGSWLETTYYIRDASGNVMSTYLNKNASFDLTERFIYGSSRLGVYKEPISMLGTAPTDLTYVRPGYKQYELTNHTSAPLSAGLGNVTAVVTAQKVPIYTGTTIDSYSPQIVKSYDYSPFGVTRIDHNVTARLTGTFAVDGGYRYGFNGQEKDDEIKGAGNSLNYKYRMYDPRTARFFAVDPIDHLYPELTPYQHSSLNPIWMLEIEGLEGQKFQIIQKRNKPLFNESFSGGGLISKFGGSRAKYTKHNSFELSDNSKPEISQSLNDFADAPTQLETGENSFETVPNDLRPVHLGESMELYNRHDFVPRVNVGNLTTVFNPGIDEDGQGVQRTYQLGKLDAQGNEIILNEITTDQPGSISTDFALSPGEAVFTREIGESGEGANSTTTSTTTIKSTDSNR